MPFNRNVLQKYLATTMFSTLDDCLTVCTRDESECQGLQWIGGKCLKFGLMPDYGRIRMKHPVNWQSNFFYKKETAHYKEKRDPSVS